MFHSFPAPEGEQGNLIKSNAPLKCPNKKIKTDQKGLSNMFQSINTFGREQQYSAASIIDQLIAVMVEMPARFEGRPVSSRAVMISLLWQQYGLDLLHPEFSRWLERNAPDVRSAVAQNSVKNGVNAGLRVGADGKVKVELSLDFDQRLREVSSQYIRWQTQRQMQQPKPQMQQPKPQMQQSKPQMRQPKPQMQQIEPKMEREDQVATIVYLNKAAVSQKMDCYKLAS
jgi:hypothetical protein